MDTAIQALFSILEGLPQVRARTGGAGSGRFVYAKSASKAVELSLDPPGFFFEAWNTADEEADEPPCISRHVGSAQEVERLLLQWFEESPEPTSQTMEVEPRG